MATKLKRVEDQIERIKQELVALGFMRPGSITRQYRFPKERRRPFYQISYTYCMRSRSEYVRPGERRRASQGNSQLQAL